MKCNNPICRKETELTFRLTTGIYVCENCALLAGMIAKEINKIKQEAEE